MPISRRDLRQRVGHVELGIIYPGTATAVTTTQVDDTSDDSPFDPGDNAQRLNGAGILVVNGSNLNYRNNVTYVPASQRVTWTGAAAGLAGTPAYEIHTEPLLHPLLVWPRLIDRALATIRRLADQHILLTGRNYYDLTEFPDITNANIIRRLYWVGNNLLRDADWALWPTGDSGPTNWTASAALDRVQVSNYGHAAQLDATETLTQVITGFGGRGMRLRASVWCMPANTAVATLRVRCRLADGSTEREVAVTATGGATATNFELVAEIETTSRTASVLVSLETSNADTDFWAPVCYEASAGIRQRLQPSTSLLVGGDMRIYVPPESGVGVLALLLPYPALGNSTTNAADTTETEAPTELIVAATCVQVLRWLMTHSQIPSSAKEEYATALTTWEALFRHRHREEMRKLAKTQQLWEAGEIGMSRLSHRTRRYL